MTNKYSQGRYIVKVFDEFGTKIKTMNDAKTCVEAEEKGEAAGGHSYVVLRVIINSKRANE